MLEAHVRSTTIKLLHVVYQSRAKLSDADLPIKRMFSETFPCLIRDVSLASQCRSSSCAYWLLDLAKAPPRTISRRAMRVAQRRRLAPLGHRVASLTTQPCRMLPRSRTTGLNLNLVFHPVWMGGCFEETVSMVVMSHAASEVLPIEPGSQTNRSNWPVKS